MLCASVLAIDCKWRTTILYLHFDRLRPDIGREIELSFTDAGRPAREFIHSSLWRDRPQQRAFSL
ncbi:MULTISPECIES: hypothetical protein [unclassified Microcoleus]|uniref:hypothetical protein n=1 Tax=unclassified Microcoleus TaxID=2642155 RepID=UPI002FD3CEC3